MCAGRGGPRSRGAGPGLRVLMALLCWSRVGAGNSLNDDLLLPYAPHSLHGPLHQHRHVRDCQPKLHGNVTYETWPGNNISEPPVATSRVFVSMFSDENGNQKPVSGHFTFVNSPLRTLSVLEPGGAGGCSYNRTATVGHTSRLGKCFVAQNGGYFNVTTGECLGNVVSDGRLVKNAKGIQNAQFGIRADGTMVFGYLSEEDVLDNVNPFVQLVSGVIWLLRDGEVYIEDSKRAECDETQTTGTFDHFINVISARTAVGHDRLGRLVLFHADGQTDSRGLTLWEVAHFLKEQGVVNAINLDGGGSATLIVNGTLASYPSDHCVLDNMWRCPRSISTVLCVHALSCDPADCGGHGDCVQGECHCSGSWSGVACNVLDCGPLNCGRHGICTQNGCLCDAGWMGSSCREVCASGFYGDGCTRECLCQNGGTCDIVNGSCTCRPGYQGKFCEQAGRCLASEPGSTKDVQTGEHYYLTERTWIIFTTCLALLLVLGAACTLKRALCCRANVKRQDGDYVYHQLKETSGNLPSEDISESQGQWHTEVLEHNSHL